MDGSELFLSLLRHSLTGEGALETNPLQEEEAEALFALSAAHGVAHLVGYASKRRGLLPAGKALESFTGEIDRAVFSYVQGERALAALGLILEGADIPYIPLKGAVLRYRYPEPWMRNSCDLDLLVPRERHAEAVALLLRQGYRHLIRTGHDDSFLSPDGLVHIELHFDLLLCGEAGDRFLREVWQRATVCEGCRARRQMDAECFYTFHIAHMARHVLSGGCGVRPFADLYILRREAMPDSPLLSMLGLSRFAGCATALAASYFEGTPIEEELAAFSRFVLAGGVYGTTAQRAGVGRAVRGRLGYLFRRVLPPYRAMCGLYPVLRRFPLLLPLYHVRRWFRLFHPHGAGIAHAWRETRALRNGRDGDAAAMLNTLGLSAYADLHL